MIKTIPQLISPQYFFKKYYLDLPVTKQKSNIRTIRKKLGKHVKQNAMQLLATYRKK